MMIDYRIYCTIYGLCFLVHCASIALVEFRSGRYFWPVTATNLAVVGSTVAVHYLDWLWS